MSHPGFRGRVGETRGDVLVERADGRDWLDWVICPWVRLFPSSRSERKAALVRYTPVMFVETVSAH